MQTSMDTAAQETYSAPLAASILPVELEIDILHYFVHPEVILDEKISPHQFFIYYQALVNEQVESFVSASRARKKGLRLVCRRWRTIADTILPRWEYRVRGLERHRVPSSLAKTSQINGIMEECLDFLTVHHQHTNVTYKQPITTFRFDTDGWMVETYGVPLDPVLLKRFIHHPKELRALHISTKATTLTLSSLLYIQDSIQNLVTLSIHVKKVELLNSALSLPRLSTLIIYIVLLNHTDTAPLTWDFPSLKNLSLKRPDASGFRTLPVSYNFITDLVTRFSSQIAALHLPSWCAYTNEPVPPTFWQDFPRLEVLATDFSYFSTSSSFVPAPSLHPIRHLISTVPTYRPRVNPITSTSIASEPNTLNGLENVIAFCPSLESVTLLYMWLNGRVRGQPQQAAMVESLRQLCSERGVKLIDIYGKEINEN